MNAEQARSLDAINRHLRQLQANLDPASRLGKTTEYCCKVLSRFVTEADTQPQIDAAKLKAYKVLLPDLIATLADDDAAAALSRNIAEYPDLPAAERAVQRAVNILGARSDNRARAALRRIAAIELDQLEGFEAAVVAEQATVAETMAEVQSGALTVEQISMLTACIRAQYPEEETLRIVGSTVVSGGFSKQTIIITLADTVNLPGSLVLRIDKPVAVLNTAIANEFPVIEAMYAAGVEVPRPYFLHRDTATLGGAFAVLGLIPGKNIGDPFEVFEPSLIFGRSLAQELAKLHAVDPAGVGDHLHGAKLAVKDRAKADISACADSWRSYDQIAIGEEAALGWLLRNIDLADGPRCIAHCDVGCHNLLVEDGRITGVLDWEMALVGTPAQDLGVVYPIVVQIMPWNDFLDEYRKAGGTPPSPQQIDFYRIWRDVWMIWSLSQARAAIAGGLAGDVGLAYTLTQQHRIALRLQRQLCTVMEIEA